MKMKYFKKQYILKILLCFFKPLLHNQIFFNNSMCQMVFEKYICSKSSEFTRSKNIWHIKLVKENLVV